MKLMVEFELQLKWNKTVNNYNYILVSNAYQVAKEKYRRKFYLACVQKPVSTFLLCFFTVHFWSQALIEYKLKTDHSRFTFLFHILCE